MSKTLEETPESFRHLVSTAPVRGDQREVTRVIRKGEEIRLKDHRRPYVVARRMRIIVTETYANGYWEITGWHLATAEPVPTLWQRFKRWAVSEPIPAARVVKR